MVPLTPDQEACMRQYGKSFWRNNMVEELIQHMREAAQRPFVSENDVPGGEDE